MSTNSCNNSFGESSDTPPLLLIAAWDALHGLGAFASPISAEILQLLLTFPDADMRIALPKMRSFFSQTPHIGAIDGVPACRHALTQILARDDTSVEVRICAIEFLAAICVGYPVVIVDQIQAIFDFFTFHAASDVPQIADEAVNSLARIAHVFAGSSDFHTAVGALLEIQINVRIAGYRVVQKWRI
jgi:hypothetical protein